jgi:hypothetical protein
VLPHGISTTRCAAGKAWSTPYPLESCWTPLEPLTSISISSWKSTDARQKPAQSPVRVVGKLKTPDVSQKSRFCETKKPRPKVTTCRRASAPRAAQPAAAACSAVGDRMEAGHIRLLDGRAVINRNPSLNRRRHIRTRDWKLAAAFSERRYRE